jgi:hypothetical protein
MPTLNTTPNRAYPEPFVGNDLATDVGRIIAALRDIDTDVSDAFAQIVVKAGLVSPAFTGTPTAPTATPGDGSNKIANTAFVSAALADLIVLLEAAIALKADAAATTASFAATTAALADKAALLSSGTSDNAFDDADELAYVTATTQKRGTLAGLISSIFKTARTIANAQFASSSFKLFNAAGTPRALTFNTESLTADRVVTWPNRAFSAGKEMEFLGTTTLTGATLQTLDIIPERVNHVRVLFEITTSAAAELFMRLGTGVTIVSTGYDCVTGVIAASTAGMTIYTTGVFLTRTATLVGPYIGVIDLYREVDNGGGGCDWFAKAQTKTGTGAVTVSNKVTLSQELTRLQFLTTAGTPTLTGEVHVWVGY